MQGHSVDKLDYASLACYIWHSHFDDPGMQQYIRVVGKISEAKHGSETLRETAGEALLPKYAVQHTTKQME